MPHESFSVDYSGVSRESWKVNRTCIQLSGRESYASACTSILPYTRPSGAFPSHLLVGSTGVSENGVLTGASCSFVFCLASSSSCVASCDVHRHMGSVIVPLVSDDGEVLCPKLNLPHSRRRRENVVTRVLLCRESRSHPSRQEGSWFEVSDGNTGANRGYTGSDEWLICFPMPCIASGVSRYMLQVWFDRKRLPSLSFHQDATQSPFGCVGGSCWAGVYIDSGSNEVVHLKKGGRAFFSPGTAAGTRRGSLWWKAEGDRLRIVDSDEQPLVWLGTVTELRRDPLEAGKMAGFGVEVKSSRGATRVEKSHLVRDSFGFLFPGCTYVLSLRSQSPQLMKGNHEHRVVINEDGTVTDIVKGTQIARWSFPEAEPPFDDGDESWATGDEVLLVVDKYYDHVRIIFASPACS